MSNEIQHSGIGQFRIYLNVDNADNTVDFACCISIPCAASFQATILPILSSWKCKHHIMWTTMCNSIGNIYNVLFLFLFYCPYVIYRAQNFIKGNVPKIQIMIHITTKSSVSFSSQALPITNISSKSVNCFYVYEYVY